MIFGKKSEESPETDLSRKEREKAESAARWQAYLDHASSDVRCSRSTQGMISNG